MYIKRGWKRDLRDLHQCKGPKNNLILVWSKYIFWPCIIFASLLSKVVSAHDRLTWDETTFESKLAKRMHGQKMHLLHTNLYWLADLLTLWISALGWSSHLVFSAKSWYSSTLPLQSQQKLLTGWSYSFDGTPYQHTLFIQITICLF